MSAQVLPTKVLRPSESVPTKVLALREMLEQRFPDAVPVTHRSAEAIATGIPALDHALPGEGLPRGRIVAWAPGGGATAVLRTVCETVTRRGERAAWIDGEGVAAGDFWRGGTSLVRPAGERQARVCAEELLRSGGFALVVLAGGRPTDAGRVRLSRVAKEGGGALAILDRSGFMASMRLHSRIAPDGYRWSTNPFGEAAEVEAVTLCVGVTALGWKKQAELTLSVASYDLCLSVEPGLGDRRGAAR